MELLDKVLRSIGSALYKMAGGQPGAKEERNKAEIRKIFNEKVKDGESYDVVAGVNMVITNKLTKQIQTYYNYIIGYRDGDDPELVIISTTYDFASVSEPVVCKKSECKKAEYDSAGKFSITHPKLGDAPLDFVIIVTAGWGTLIIPVSYVEEFTPFVEFFQNRFAK
ncbi:MAG: hypothetical protein LBB85_11210 [Dysgonamonadaceae bacterium]|nr:hypothetical protein [Dysgonamonadaceae bacterium]